MISNFENLISNDEVVMKLSAIILSNVNPGIFTEFN